MSTNMCIYIHTNIFVMAYNARLQQTIEYCDKYQGDDFVFK